MLTLFIRTLLVYIFMFVVLRLMGKRQLSDMQPFDLAITLLIANLAALPMSDPAIPLLYGVVPIIAMFALHRLISFMSLKSEKLRKLVCGSPLVMISGGVVREDAMRAANYSLFDLAEQLRMKDVFSISQVEYAILETDGGLSVLLKGPFQTPTNEGLKLESEKAMPALLLICDGQVHPEAVRAAGLDEKGFYALLKRFGIDRPRTAFLCPLIQAELFMFSKSKKTAQRFAHALRICTKKNDAVFCPHKMHGKTNALPVTEEPYDESGKKEQRSA